jgi:ABC-type amino acid transport substrate-binding protein
MTQHIDQSALEWRKATKSNPSGNCLEVAQLADGGIAVRDSKQQGRGPVLQYTPQEWEAFVDGVKKGEFDALCQSSNLPN